MYYTASKPQFLPPPTQTAIEIMNYTFEFCTKNEACTQDEIQELLEDVMDQEFDTICEDDSTAEISACLVRYLALCREQKYDEIVQELSRLPACTQWLTPQFKVQYAPQADSSSDEDDDDDDSNEDNEMVGSGASATPARQTRAARGAASSSSNGAGSMETEEDDGWTTVQSRRRN